MERDAIVELGDYDMREQPRTGLASIRLAHSDLRIANGWPSSEIDARMPWKYAA